MKIFLLVPELEEGGVEHHVVSLANQLVAFQYDVVVISNGGRLETGLNEKIIRINLPVHRKELFTAMFSAAAISRIVPKNKLSVLHAHSRVPFWVAWFVSLLCKIPWGATCHAEYSCNLALFPLKRASFCITVSKSIQQHLGKYLPDKNVRVIPNGVAEPESFWDSMVLKRRTKKFLYLGRLSGIKGIRFLLGVFSSLFRNNPWLDWVFEIAGEGSLRVELEEYARQRGIADKVVFLGHVDSPWELMSNTSCFLFPSFSEGMPLALLEAMACGCPIIASDIPSVREVVGNAEKLVSCGDTQAWELAISALICGDSVPFLKPEGNLTQSEMVKKVEELYLDVLPLSDT